mgnify:CR=1 FL=1
MIEIQEMTAADVADIAALERLCFSAPWSENSIAEELETGFSLWLVARLDGAFAGYVGAQLVPPEADMMNLAVGAEHRRQGIAAALVRALCAALRTEKGAEVLTLEVRDSNEAAIRLYAALGFTEIGRRPNYYFHPKEDARILRKDALA